MGVIVTSKFHVSCCNGKTKYLVLGTDGAASPANGIVICTSDVLEGIGVGFREASGNLHPTYIFTLCFMCFNCIFTYFIFYVPVFYSQMLISRQRLQ